MADQKREKARYLLVVWDYDAAPGAEELYFVARRARYADLAEAKSAAFEAVEEKFLVGAAVFCGNQEVAGYGLTFDRPRR